MESEPETEDALLLFISARQVTPVISHNEIDTPTLLFVFAIQDTEPFRSSPLGTQISLVCIFLYSVLVFHVEGRRQHAY